MIPSAGRQPDAFDATVEELAIKALEYLASDADRLGGFLAGTGFDAARLRAAAEGPGFAPALLGYVMGDDSLVLGLAEHAGLRPERIAAIWRRLEAEAGGEA